MRERILQGQRFVLSRKFFVRALAEDWAETLRREGRLARVITVGERYEVWHSLRKRRK